MILDPLRVGGLARADWLERSRRPAFLVLLGIGLWAAWVFTPPNHAAYATFRMAESRGVYNSAWIGGTVSLLTAVFFSLAGFYVVKNPIANDRRTGVGAVLATTPMRNVEYVLGKWIASTALLGSLAFVMMIGAAGMQWVRAEDPVFHPGALAAPFVWIALPAMAWTAALAVLFEAIPGLRGGLGNFVYFFFWASVLLQPGAVPTGTAGGWDPLGIRFLTAEMVSAGRAHVPEFAAHPERFSIGLNFRTGGWHLTTFAWEGIRWTAGVVLERLGWFLGAGVLAAMAAIPFDRFATDRGRGARAKKAREAHPERFATDPPAGAPAATGANAAERFLGTAAPVRAGTLPAAERGAAFAGLVVAELRLLFGGASWWWWLSLIAVQAPGIFAPRDIAARFAAVAWIWPALRWSALGARDREHGTTALLDSSPRPIGRQLAATLVAGIAPGLAAGAGFALRGMIAGDVAALDGWIVGAVFVPSLALALGTLTGGRKTFEIVYVVLWYMGPLNGAPFLDFTGASGAGPLPAFAIAAATLAVVAAAARARRIRRGGP